MSEKSMVPRTELLQLLRKVQPAKNDPLYEVWQMLETGKTLKLAEWTLISNWYHTIRRWNGDITNGINSNALPSFTDGERTPPSAELHSRNPATMGTDELHLRGGEALQHQAQRVGGELLAGGEQVDDQETLESAGAGASPPNGDSAAALQPRILGARRCATNTGFVVFVASIGVSGRVEIRCGVGLGLPGLHGDLDIARVLEHGALIDLDQLRENLNVPE